MLLVNLPRKGTFCLPLRFGSCPDPHFCKYYAVFPLDRCTHLTNTRTKSSPYGSVVRAADCNPSLSLVLLRWRFEVNRSFCSAVAAIQCSVFTAGRPSDLHR
ncbi:hypothetical protein Y032_0020g52 [Ancylostoma ceylanicum]|uniref:Uncharacterized protein n=1 Tax=Ancylostoma ceylanicum TaxID=53326 RepID=A0A016V0K7_9BILA|nr:hypothetical protein Y032_0020g52 [Ancylostoma ceylanicum]